MGSAVFGINPGTSNNAPPPVSPLTNPTGMSKSSGLTSSTNGLPAIGPASNAPIFGTTPGGIQSLSSALPGSNQNSINALTGAYGTGTGDVLANLLYGQGLFNPQVASAYLNAMQPAYNQGIATQEQAFGAEGARFGSAAALGIGNFSSQFALNEQQTLASMFLQSQGEELNLLQSVLPTIHSEHANSSGILGDILGGLEVAGGIALAATGVGLPAAAPLIGSGLSTVAASNRGGGGGTSNVPQTPIYTPPTPGTGGVLGTGTSPVNTTQSNANLASLDAEVSAGSTLGGADPFTGSAYFGGGFDPNGGSGGDTGIDPMLAAYFQNNNITPFL
jgi:hypothetical protein